MISTMSLLTYLAVSLPLLVFSAEGQGSSDAPPGGISVSEVLRVIEYKCLQNTGATKEDLKLLHDVNHLRETNETKCMVACVLDAFGALDERGAPSVSNLDMYLYTQFKKQDHDKVIKICLDCYTTGTKMNIQDHCDFVFQFVQCFIDGVNKEKIEKVEFWKL